MRLAALAVAVLAACHGQAPESSFPRVARVEFKEILSTTNGGIHITVNAYRMYLDGAKDLLFGINNTEVKSCRRRFVSWALYSKHFLTPSESEQLHGDDETIQCILETPDEIRLIEKPGTYHIWAVIRDRRKTVIASDTASLVVAHVPYGK